MASSSSTPREWTGPSVLDETQAQLAEVIKLMSVGEAESEAVNRLNAAHKQLTARLSRATTNAADAVRAMSSRVATKISDASRDAELTAAKAEVAAAAEEAAAMQASIAELTGTKTATEERVAALERAIGGINARLDAARAREEAAVPRLQHELGLYVNISGIKWDTKAPDGTVRGLVAPPPGQGVPGTFDLSLAELGEVGVADALWAKVGECFTSAPAA